MTTPTTRGLAALFLLTRAASSVAGRAVHLRQRGSPESKPVGAAHADTGPTG